MFKQKTVLYVKDVPDEFIDVADFIVDWGYSNYVEICPWEVLYVDLTDPKPIHERRILSWEEFKLATGLNNDNQDYYDFLVWCVNQGQREPFILIADN